MIIGAIYHPPKPKYRTSDILDHIEACVEKLATSSPDSTIILAVRWRTKWPVRTGSCQTGLTPIVKEPTRGNNCLDRIFVSEPCYIDVKVVNSAIKSDHKAIIAYSGVTKVNYSKVHTVRSFRQRSPDRYAHFMLQLWLQRWYGGRVPYWKSLFGYISTTYRAINAKFGKKKHNPIQIQDTWPKYLISKIQDGGRPPL